jgi:hypothetical protein
VEAVATSTGMQAHPSAGPIATGVPDCYWVSSKMLKERTGLSSFSIWRHTKVGNLAQGKRRPGVRGKFWTPRQANLFMTRIGCTAKRFTTPVAEWGEDWTD